jgi:hypothetical protein
MAHFAKIEDGLVTQVIVISDTDAPNPAPDRSEPLGQAFIRDTLKLDGEWKQTSYNASFRYNYAGPGYTYDSEADAFIAPQPYDSWVLSDSFVWEPPIPQPESTDGTRYRWDEDTVSWVVIEPEV